MYESKTKPRVLLMLSVYSNISHGAHVKVNLSSVRSSAFN